VNVNNIKMVKCYFSCLDLFGVPGLIVGAVIKYTSSLPRKIMKESVVTLNSSDDWTGPPDYVRLKVPFVYNESHTVKYYHYAFASHVRHEESLEPELEEKASQCFMFLPLLCIVHYTGCSIKKHPLHIFFISHSNVDQF